MCYGEARSDGKNLQYVFDKNGRVIGFPVQENGGSSRKTPMSGACNLARTARFYGYAVAWDNEGGLTFTFRHPTSAAACGYMTNDADLELPVTPSFQDALTAAMARGVLEYAQSLPAIGCGCRSFPRDVRLKRAGIVCPFSANNRENLARKAGVSRVWACQSPCGCAIV